MGFHHPWVEEGAELSTVSHHQQNINNEMLLRTMFFE